MFASEIKALLPLLPAPAEVDEASLFAYLGAASVPAPHTLFRGYPQAAPGPLAAGRSGRLGHDPAVLGGPRRRRRARRHRRRGGGARGGGPAALRRGGPRRRRAGRRLPERRRRQQPDRRPDGQGRRPPGRHLLRRLRRCPLRRAAPCPAGERHVRHPPRGGGRHPGRLPAAVARAHVAPGRPPLRARRRRVCTCWRPAARQRVKVVLSGEGSDELFAGYPKHRVARWANVAGHIPAGARGPLLDAAQRRLPAGAGRVRVAARALGEAGEQERIAGWFAPFTTSERGGSWETPPCTPPRRSGRPAAATPPAHALRRLPPVAGRQPARAGRPDVDGGLARAAAAVPRPPAGRAGLRLPSG